MVQWLTATLNTVLPSLLVAVCTAIITVRLSLRRFRAEQWWERKADAYSRIVEALHSAMEYCATQSHQDLTGERMSEEKRKQLSQDYDRAYRELRRAAGIGTYIISDEVADVLARLAERPRLDPDHNGWFEIFDADHSAYANALAEVRNLARKDLGIYGGWWGRLWGRIT